MGQGAGPAPADRRSWPTALGGGRLSGRGDRTGSLRGAGLPVAVGTQQPIDRMPRVIIASPRPQHVCASEGAMLACAMCACVPYQATMLRHYC